MGFKIGSIFKDVGKVATGAVGGFLSTGNPWGAVAGGIGGLLSSGGGGGSNNYVGTYMPPTSQEAYNIVKGLEGQIDNISSSQYNIMKPYLDEALSMFRNEPSKFEELFNNANQSITNRYSNLFDIVKTQMQNQWNKSALNLSSLGMYNTPATQLTQSDIVNQLYGKVAEAETSDLVGLDKDKLNAFLNYYSNAPQILASFGETFAKINPELDKYERMLQLAGVLNGLSGSTVIYPKTTPLQQISGMVNNYIKNNASSLPSFGDVFDKVKGIFGGGSDYTFAPPTPSYGWSNALNNAFPIPNIFG